MNLRWCLSVTVMALLATGCDTGPHSDAPVITFPGGQLNENQIHQLGANRRIETSIALSKPEDRTVFLEILTNGEYQQGKLQELIPGDDWGGRRFTGRGDSNGVSSFEFAETGVDFYDFTPGETYWVRSGVLIGQRDFGILVSLIEMPIDRRSGYLFETIDGNQGVIRVAFGVSDYLPFTVIE